MLLKAKKNYAWENKIWNCVYCDYKLQTQTSYTTANRQINIGYPEMLLLNAFLNVNVNVNLLKY